MIVERDHRTRSSEVVIRMPLDEFRETVEWLELLSPDDGCTRDYRAALDRIDPPRSDDDGD